MGLLSDLFSAVLEEVSSDKDNGGLTALHKLARKNDGDVADAIFQISDLLENGAEVDARDDNGWTPLHHAARCGGDSIVALNLLDGGANPNARTNDGSTPLHLVARNDQALAFTILMSLTEKGAQPNAVDDAGNTPLHVALRHNPDNYGLYNALVEQGADVNALNAQGWTPLHLAARYSGNILTVQDLLERGADLAATTQAGETPADLAEKNTTEEADNIRKMLQQAQDKTGIFAE